MPLTIDSVEQEDDLTILAGEELTLDHCAITNAHTLIYLNIRFKINLNLCQLVSVAAKIYDNSVWK